jgi:hypothetical protein
MNTSIVTGIF